jgi:ribosomal protein S18 acetylase RimI-like enzyme
MVSAEFIFIADWSNPAHGDAVVQLLDAYALDAMGGGAGLSEFAKTHLVAELAQRPQAHAILAEVDGQAVGLLIGIEGFSTFACKSLLNIHDVYVAPAYRGKGLSTRLLTRAQELAEAAGCCKLTLEVLQGNTVAQASYRAFGFEGYALQAATGQAMFWQKKLAV